MAKWIKSMQASACDNEQLSIKCNEDYIIDVITVEHTILPAVERKQDVKETTVNSNNNQNSTTITKLSLSDSKSAGEQQEQVVCQQPSPAVLQLSSSSLGGNGTTTTNNNYNNGTQPGVCDQNQAKTLTSSRDIAMLVRNECRSRNTCTLDLRWPRAANGNANSTNKIDTEQQATATNGTSQKAISGPNTPPSLSPPTSQALGLRANGYLLSKLFNEPCPGNRKLIEIVYKCRPLKMSKRTVCQNSPLRLECPNQRRLVVISGDYGAWANDTKNHERCLSDPANRQMTNQQQALPSSSSSTTNSSNSNSNNNSNLQGPFPVAQPVQLSKNCLVSSSNTVSILANNCLLRRSCDLSVTPATFGDAQCPIGQVEYLKMVYICINETLLIEASPSSLNGSLSSPSSLLTRPLITKAYHSGRDLETQPFSISSKSSNVSSLLSQDTTNLASSISSSQHRIADMSNDQQLSAGRSSQSVASINIVSGGQSLETGANAGLSNQALNQPSDILEDSPHSSQPFDTLNGPLIPHVPLVNSGQNQLFTSPLPSSQNAHPSFSQRLKYTLIRYQSPLVALTMAMVSLMLFAITLRSCRLRSATSNSSSASKDSTCSTKSSTGFKSYGSSSSSSHSTHGLGNGIGNGGSHQHQNINSSNNTKHNSCSESCFSLDEYNFNTGSNGNQSLDSPAPPNSSNTPLDNDNTNLDATSSFGAQTVRPKLWTIYSNSNSNNNNEQAVTNPLRMSTQHHHTMRPTRSFVGQHQRQQQQQSSQIHQLRALQCLHQAQQIQAPQLPPSTRDSLASAQDLLLQTAPNQQPIQQINHHHQQQQQAINWCNTTQQQVESSQQIDSQTQAQLSAAAAAAAAAAATIPHLHHVDSASSVPTAPPQHCAFHHHHHQQQQQHLIFTPQNIQLEFSQPGATILASQHQPQPEQQQQSQQSLQLLQHQQQQAVLDMRQFHPNFHP